MKVPNLENIHIIFHHKRPSTYCGMFSSTHIQEKGYTICKIFKGDELVGEGRADCSLEDNFSRPFGRYLASERTLEKAAPSLVYGEETSIREYIESFPSHKRYFKTK